VQGQCLGRSRQLRVEGQATRGLEALGIGVVSHQGLRVGPGDTGTCGIGHRGRRSRQLRSRARRCRDLMCWAWGRLSRWSRVKSWAMWGLEVSGIRVVG